MQSTSLMSRCNSSELQNTYQNTHYQLHHEIADHPNYQQQSQDFETYTELSSVSYLRGPEVNPEVLAMGPLSMVSSSNATNSESTCSSGHHRHQTNPLALPPLLPLAHPHQHLPHYTNPKTNPPDIELDVQNNSSNVFCQETRIENASSSTSESAEFAHHVQQENMFYEHLNQNQHHLHHNHSQTGHDDLQQFHPAFDSNIFDENQQSNQNQRADTITYRVGQFYQICPDEQGVSNNNISNGASQFNHSQAIVSNDTRNPLSRLDIIDQDQVYQVTGIEEQQHFINQEQHHYISTGQLDVPLPTSLISQASPLITERSRHVDVFGGVSFYTNPNCFQDGQPVNQNQNQNNHNHDAQIDQNSGIQSQVHVQFNPIDYQQEFVRNINKPEQINEAPNNQQSGLIYQDLSETTCSMKMSQVVKKQLTGIDQENNSIMHPNQNVNVNEGSYSNTTDYTQSHEFKNDATEHSSSDSSGSSSVFANEKFIDEFHKSLGLESRQSSRSSNASTMSSEECTSGMSRDERKARDANIPLSYEDIVNMSIDQFNEQMGRFQLSTTQVNLIKDIRRRGKNKVAAQSCRKRKMDQIDELQHEVSHLINQRLNLSYERSQLALEYQSLIQDYEKIQSVLMTNNQNDQNHVSNDINYLACPDHSINNNDVSKIIER